MSKIVVVLGPTASGKTALAVQLASKFKAEIISADSRQIYKSMDIGTGKDLNEYNINNGAIPYHLIDILNPLEDYSVFRFKNDFFKTYKTLINKNKLAILCGGTGLYVESILLNYQMPNISPNKELRERFEKYNLKSLIIHMKKLDKYLYDPNYHTTKRRAIRAIEIISSKDNLIPETTACPIDSPLVLGIKVGREVLLKKIKERLEIRLNSGMIEEVEGLIKSGLTIERLQYFGLEYKFIGQYLFNQFSYDEMKIKLNYAINRFSKRQMTFFRRMEKRGVKIHWLTSKSMNDSYKFIIQYLN
tara:strand:- start:45 stop:953 length:909 start_codon:yes stop_codon:yes gene_type:complete